MGLEVSRSRRFVGAFLNAITLNFLLIGNLILVLTKGATLGGLALGYKYEKPGFGTAMKIFAGGIISGLLYFITFYIFFIVDVCMMGRNNGWFWEKWLDCRKVRR